VKAGIGCLISRGVGEIKFRADPDSFSRSPEDPDSFSRSPEDPDSFSRSPEDPDSFSSDKFDKALGK
jgi:hypothetical protein